MSLTHRQAGSLFLITAPSGAGKSSLVKALLARQTGIQLSISYTTRSPRPGEENGREYHFISVEDFLSRQAKGEFVESAKVHGNYYGTSRTLINQFMSAGTDMLLEIDWQGAAQIKQQFPEAISIFILPPSIKELENRLTKRAQDSSEIIAQRLLAADGEIAHAGEFEYVIINAFFDDALNDLIAIISATRCRFNQQAAKNKQLFEQFKII